jgi:hypothetical protein
MTRGRITPEEVVDAFDRLGARSCRREFVKQRGTVFRCCPLTAIAIGLMMDPAYVRKGEFAVLYYLECAGWNRHYLSSFMHGVDGELPDDYTDLMGYADGRAAWAELVRRERVPQELR